MCLKHVASNAFGLVFRNVVNTKCIVGVSNGILPHEHRYMYASAVLGVYFRVR